MTIYDVLSKIAEMKTSQSAESENPIKYDYSRAKEKETYTPNVRIWQSYYNGTVQGIHTDTGFNGERTYTINRKSMKVPKEIAKKWATSLFSEQFKVTLKNDTDTEKFNELARKTNFRCKISDAAIWGYSEGTSAILAKADLKNDGSGGKVQLDIVKYDSIYPIVFTKDEIQVIAFVKKQIQANQQVYVISIHSEIDGVYQIENLQATVTKTGRKEELTFSATDAIVSNTYQNGQYAVIRPNTVNDYTEILPFGQSVYADALAACDDVDLAAAGLRRDVKEGDQVTFIGRDLLLETGANGEKTKKYFNNDQGRFFTIPQSLGMNDGEIKKQLYDKVVPEIRAEQYWKVIKDSLNWACVNSGLGKGSLDIIPMATATQVIHTESEKMQNKSLHEQYLEGEIICLIKAMCELSGLCGNPIDASEVSIVWEDSVIIDTAEQKRLAMAEVDAGLMLPYEYRMKFLGESEEEAKAKLAEIKETDNSFNMPDYSNEYRPFA